MTFFFEKLTTFPTVLAGVISTLGVLGFYLKGKSLCMALVTSLLEKILFFGRNGGREKELLWKGSTSLGTGKGTGKESFPTTQNRNRNGTHSKFKVRERERNAFHKF